MEKNPPEPLNITPRRTSFLGGLQLVVRAGGRDDLGAQRLAQLHGHGAHAATGAGDQEPLVGLQVAARHQTVVAGGVAHVEAGLEQQTQCDSDRACCMGMSLSLYIYIYNM